MSVRVVPTRWWSLRAWRASNRVTRLANAVLELPKPKGPDDLVPLLLSLRELMVTYAMLRLATVRLGPVQGQDPGGQMVQVTIDAILGRYGAYLAEIGYAVEEIHPHVPPGPPHPAH